MYDKIRVKSKIKTQSTTISTECYNNDTIDVFWVCILEHKKSDAKDISQHYNMQYNFRCDEMNRKMCI